MHFDRVASRVSCLKKLNYMMMMLMMMYNPLNACIDRRIAAC